MIFGQDRVFIGAQIAGRMQEDDDLQHYMDAGNTPRFGFYWWQCLPSIRTNGGKFKNRDCVDINFHWLCFATWLTIYPKKH